jgi:hypothetical protein
MKEATVKKMYKSKKLWKDSNICLRNTKFSKKMIGRIAKRMI